MRRKTNNYEAHYWNNLENMFWDAFRLTENAFKILYGQNVERWKAPDNSWRIGCTIPAQVAPLVPDQSFMHTSPPRAGELIRIINFTGGDFDYGVILWVRGERVGFKKLPNGPYNTCMVDDLEAMSSSMEKLRWQL